MASAARDSCDVAARQSPTEYFRNSQRVYNEHGDPHDRYVNLAHFVFVEYLTLTTKDQSHQTLDRRSKGRRRSKHEPTLYIQHWSRMYVLYT